jgi:hypothetical protein
MSTVKYELGFYIPEDDILYSHCRENLKSYRLYAIYMDCFHKEERERERESGSSN